MVYFVPDLVSAEIKCGAIDMRPSGEKSEGCTYARAALSAVLKNAPVETRDVCTALRESLGV